ncbi:MAG: RsiV family protein [Oscillospiraceae bacterium]
MNDFDRYLKSKAAEEAEELPESVKNRVEQTLAGLPERTGGRRRSRALPRMAAAAACFVFVALFLLPNVSVAYAQALEKVPVIGDIARVVTIRNYYYSDDMHEMDIDVPQIDEENSEAAAHINKDIDELTKTLVDRFYEDLAAVGGEGHGSVYVDYETVTDTEQWFTLKIRVHEAAGSSNTYFKYYHIDKRDGKMVRLGDLSGDENFYEVLEEEIKRQMELRMEQDSNAVYWLDDSLIGEDFVTLTPEHNFYFNENGDLVIVFDKYEVAPGSMGTPEFTVSKALFRALLKPEFADVVS